MNTSRACFFAVIVSVCSIAAAARAAEPWEAVAIKAMTTMNRGDGPGFAEIAHTDYKNRMRRFLVARMRANPKSPDTQKALADLEAANLEAVEAMPLDRFVQKTIQLMHVAVPTAMRTALAEAQFKAIKSELQDDTQRVTLEMTFTVSGKPGSKKMVRLARREGDEWKYYGEAD